MNKILTGIILLFSVNAQCASWQITYPRPLDSATTIESTSLGSLPIELSEFTKHIGYWGVDVMIKNNIPYIIDINPRFSGEYPFFHLAGANIPAALCAWVANKELNPEWLAPKQGVSGFKDLVPTIVNNKYEN